MYKPSLAITCVVGNLLPLTKLLQQLMSEMVHVREILSRYITSSGQANSSEKPWSKAGIRLYIEMKLGFGGWYAHFPKVERWKLKTHTHMKIHPSDVWWKLLRYQHSVEAPTLS